MPFACEDGQGQRRFSNPIVANLGHFYGPCIVEIASVVFTVVKPRQFFRFGLESWVQVNRNFRSKKISCYLQAGWMDESPENLNVLVVKKL